MDRREELERKRQKLAELRRARDDRRKQMIRREQTESTTTEEKNQFLDDLIRSVVSDKKPSHARTGSHSDRSEDGSDSSTTAPFSPKGAVSPSDGLPNEPRLPPKFSSVDAIIFNFPPKERVQSSQEAQTTGDYFERPDPEEVERTIQKRLQAEKEKDRQAKIAAEEEERRRRLEQEAALTRELTEEEKAKIASSEVFIEFIDHSIKVTERALNERYDFMKDYTLLQEDDGEAESSNTVKLAGTFHDEKLCHNRAVTDVHWSPKQNELIAAAYNTNETEINEPDGLVLVWNMHSPEKPEFVFYSQSDVLTARFSDFHENLIIGGTHSGQILLWDTREKSLPVLRTPLSAIGHTHPIYAMDMVGSQNAHNLITASTDGLICSWQLDMLAQPQEILELVHPAHPKTEEIAVTCFGFPDNETTTFWTGTEEGNVYQANRYDRAGSKAGVNQYDTYQAHHGCVTGLHFHPFFGPIDFSDLFLTSSVDWTVKLWRSKSISKPSTSQQIITPIYSFEDADDYIYDVKWSPSHPAMFASVDGSGHFNLWNLNVDTEVPVVSSATGTGRALNKLAWEKDGRKAGTGSIDGHVYVYDIGEMSTPRMEEWTLLQKTVNEMENSNKESNTAPVNTKPSVGSY